MLKSDLEIAPVFHRLPDRIWRPRADLLLALVHYRVMRMRLKTSGSSASPKTALEMLRRIQKPAPPSASDAYRHQQDHPGTTICFCGDEPSRSRINGL